MVSTLCFERVILSAGAMLSFSVWLQNARCPKAKELENSRLIYPGHCCGEGLGGLEVEIPCVRTVRGNPLMSNIMVTRGCD